MLVNIQSQSLIKSLETDLKTKVKKIILHSILPE